MRKSVTLMELLVAISLVSVVAWGAFSFSLAANQFLSASEKKVEVLNELTFVLDYLHKNIAISIGYDNEVALTPGGATPVWTLTMRRDTDGNPSNFGEADRACTFNASANTIVCAGEILTDSFISPVGDPFDIDIDPATGEVFITSLTLRHNPAIDAHQVSNPEATVRDVRFFSLGQSTSP